jgi:hypothetical protein
MSLKILTRLRDSDRMKLYTNKAWLTKRVINDKKAPEDIAKECVCSTETISVYMANFNINKT